MIIRLSGLVSIVLVVISFLSYFGIIEVTATSFKQFIETLIQLGNTIRQGLQSL